MRKFVFGLLFLGLLSVSALAITADKLNEANEILTQMDSKISELREYVQVARDGSIRNITLTAQQRQNLRDKYDTAKQELVTLFNQLP